MPKASRQDFFLDFQTAREFDRAFERKGEDTGIFFPTDREVSVGEPACIRVVIAGLATPVFLKGIIAWRRARSGGPDLPRGMFIRLHDRDRARLDGIVRFLGLSPRNMERRKSQRLPVDASASYETSKGEFRSAVLNLSESGVFLRCTGPLLSVGARIPLTLFLNGETRKGVRLTAKVAWIDLFNESKGMGLVFDGGQSGLKHVSRALKRIRRELDGVSSD